MAAERAWRASVLRGAGLVYVPRLYPAWLVTAFWRVLATVFAVTLVDVAGIETGTEHDVMNWIARIWP